MRVADRPHSIDDEGAGKLRCVALAEAPLLGLAQLILEPRKPDARTGHPVERPSPQAIGPVSGAVWARHARDLHVPFGTERRRLLGSPEPDQDHAGARLLETFPVVTQLRDVRSAKRSPEVAEEREDRGSLAPERGQKDLPAVSLENRGIRGALAHLEPS